MGGACTTPSPGIPLGGAGITIEGAGAGLGAGAGDGAGAGAGADAGEAQAINVTVSISTSKVIIDFFISVLRLLSSHYRTMAGDKG